MNVYHTPALLNESIDGLNIRPEGVYVDVTFGGGGHSREILKRLGEKGRLYAFDQDADVCGNRIDDPRFVLIRSNFRYLKNTCITSYDSYLKLWQYRSSSYFRPPVGQKADAPPQSMFVLSSTLP
jgi:16S rRNA C1402 N4-methylase RsmH